MRSAALLAAVAACGGGTSSSTKKETTTPPPGDTTRGATASECPTDEVLVQDLRTLQSTTPMQDAVSIDACAPGRFSRPGWVIAARASNERDGDAVRFMFVLDTEHAMIAAMPQEPIDPRSDAEPVALSVADLDDDGEDEVLAVSAHSEGGISERWLTVWSIVDDSAFRISELNLLYDEPGGVRCETAFEVAPPGLILFTEIDGEANEMCEDPGEARFRLDGTLLREQ